MSHQAEWQKILETATAKHGVPGAVLAISQRGKITVANTGVLSVETNEAVRPDSLFQIGSVTKVVTATLVMVLVDDGRIDLDAPVRQYLPEFRTSDIEAPKVITVRQLLCHTSGLDGDFMTDTGSGDDRLARYLDRCALLPHLFKPGSNFSYSNAAYTIAGRIIEVVTGLSFDAALRKHIFEPLGLKNSVSDLKDMPGRSLASGHTPDPENPGASVRVPNLFVLGASASPAGSTTMMSAEDLIAFARMQLAGGKSDDGGEVLSQSSVEAMQEVQVRLPVAARGIDAWGLGWFYQDVDGIGLFGHDGATVGQCAYLRVDKRTDTIGVLYANGGSMNDCFLEVFGETFDKIVGCETPSAPEELDAQPDDVGRYAGVYRNIAGDTTIAVEDGRLTRKAFMRIDDTVIEQPKVPMGYAGDDNFTWRLPNQVFPTTTSFRDFDNDGRPRSIFSGLRWHHRVS